MLIKQLSIFLENKSGRLTEVLQTLGDENINVTALTIADTSEFGILRMIVSDPEKAYSVLKKKDFSVNMNEVLSIATPTEAGSYAKALHILSDSNISVEYMYAFSIGEKSILFMRTADTEKAIKVIQEKKMELIRASDLFKF